MDNNPISYLCAPECIVGTIRLFECYVGFATHNNFAIKNVNQNRVLKNKNKFFETQKYSF